MANLENVANVKLDRVVLYVGGDTGWLMSRMEFEVGYEALPISVARSSEPIGHKVGRRRARGRCVFCQMEAAQSRILLGQLSTPWHALTPGTDLPVKTMQVHDPVDGDDTNDLFIYRASFRVVKRTVDGQGLVELEVDFEGEVDSNGKFWRVGMTAS